LQFLRTFLPFVLATSLAAPCGAAPLPGADRAEPSPAPYALPDTAVHELHAAALGRDYPLYVSLPPSYGSSKRSYPVVFVTDAPYAFPVTRAIAARVGGHSQALPEFILVGLGYARGDTPEYSRRRDYTPSAHGDRGARSDMPGRAPAFGEAEAYRRFIADEVFPFIAAHYRADMAHKVFAGHSYGSLLGAWVLLTAPGMFDGYVLGSPSLWYDDHLLFAREREYAAAHADLRANVYLGVGSFETLQPKSAPRDPRYNRDNDMVADTRAFARALDSHRYPGLRLRTDVIGGEDHLTVAPVLITRGLLWTLGEGGARAAGKASGNKSG
jgi:predicted alpha/beta superfamily hydrolase